jgi:hypothetical protein
MHIKAKLFEYVIIWHPTEQQEKQDGAKAKIIVDLTRLLAKDVSSAQTIAARAIPTEYIDQLDQVEVLFRAS